MKGKKKFHIIWITLALALLAALTFSACSGGNGDSKFVFSVSFETGCETQIGTIIAYEGKQIQKPEDPVRPNYTFLGWWDNPKYEGEAATFPYKPTESVRFYAKWQGNPCVVTFETNGGSAVAPIPTRVGESFTRPSNPTKPGYVFAGWYATPDFSR